MFGPCSVSPRVFIIWRNYIVSGIRFVDEYRRGVLSCLVVRALSTRHVSLSSLNGGYCALAESATDMFCCARLSLIGGVADHLIGVVRRSLSRIVGT